MRYRSLQISVSPAAATCAVFVFWAGIFAHRPCLAAEGGDVVHRESPQSAEAAPESPRKAPRFPGTSGRTEVTAPQSAAAAPESPRKGAESPGAPEQIEVTAPQLVEFVKATYPEEALREQLEGRVVLALTIDSSGVVQQAEVVEGAGHGFDVAAAWAALAFRFEPARRAGIPTAVRILYAYDFRLPGEAVRHKPRSASTRTPEKSSTSATSSEQTSSTSATSSGQTSSASTRGPESRSESSSTFTQGRSALEAASTDSGQKQEPQEIVVVGQSEADRLRESAQAVTVVEITTQKRQSADLGEVLARTQGVGVRRAGGLGSESRFSLNGLDGEQVRFFLDGIPLHLAGYPFGIENVPVNFVERAEIYRGVVPVRFGADALGGAVHLVTDHETTGTHAGLSYQMGSFSTQRATAVVRHQDDQSGFFSSLEGFADASDNDYMIDVEVPDDDGQLTPARVRRFNDAYRAIGVRSQAGWVKKPWAQHLLFSGFYTDYRKELQHNVTMSVPYGEARFGGRSAGGNVRYRNTFGKGVSGNVVLGYAHNRADFLDVAECVYDWFGQCIREQRTAGETEAQPHDRSLWDNTGFARLNLEWLVGSDQALRLSMAPTYFTRTGNERRQTDPEARDPLAAQRDVLSVVTGLEYEVDLLSRLENILFVKYYHQALRAEEILPGNNIIERLRDTSEFGLGNGLKYRIAKWIYAKASYEWATRLPAPYELFGNGVQIAPNLELSPERSHNLNLSVVVDDIQTSWGDFETRVSGFLRELENLIILFGAQRLYTYENIYGARSAGVELAATWTSPGEFVELGGNMTYLDYRNTSDEGTFGAFAGDRIANQPYLFANGWARLKASGALVPHDEVSLNYYSRYTYEFFRSWESVGIEGSKQMVPPQLLHTIAVTYLIEGDPLALSFTAEAQNVTNEKTYDFYGIQRPGRAFFFKTTAEF